VLSFSDNYIALSLSVVRTQLGLFIYDVFWVFGTDVMVTVAKGFDAPIKLLYPKTVITEGVKTEFSMLGLGDIVIPG
jgi:minor histocompatibility antigen H13